ncbi:MAG: hypothetical protein R3E39_09585 [Anaerolineae bacterium]
MMDTPRIRTGHAKGEVAPNTWGDFEWARSHHRELLEKYGSCVALIYQQQVLATGSTYAEALTNAENNLPSEIAEATPITYLVGPIHRLHRVRVSKGQ